LDPKDEFIRVVISALHEACADNGYDLLLNCVATKQGDHDVLESALDGRIDGLILLSPPDGRDAVKLQSAGVPVVAISDRVPMLPSVIPDNFFGGQLQARHLAGLGHKRILYLGDQERYVSVVDRESGFLAEAETLGLEVELVFLARADHPQGLLGRSEVQDDLRRGRWTAIVAWSDHRAQLVCDLLTRAGFEIPRDVSVVGFNGTDHGVPLRFELTTIDAGHRNVVLQACEHLFSLLRGEAIPALTALPVTLLVGSTTGPTSEMSNEGHQRK
jgi:DNA-binding LacI/PurR family transcriptional regulator